MINSHTPFRAQFLHSTFLQFSFNWFDLSIGERHACFIGDKVTPDPIVLPCTTFLNGTILTYTISVRKNCLKHYILNFWVKSVQSCTTHTHTHTLFHSLSNVSIIYFVFSEVSVLNKTERMYLTRGSHDSHTTSVSQSLDYGMGRTHPSMAIFVCLQLCLNAANAI